MAEIEVKNLEDKDIARLVEKAGEGDPEGLYILRTEVWDRPGPSYTDYCTYKVLLGEVREIELDREYNYPTTDKSEILIIPLTIPVVLHFRTRWDFGRDRGAEDEIVVFTSSGWKRVSI